MKKFLLLVFSLSFSALAFSQTDPNYLAPVYDTIGEIVPSTTRTVTFPLITLDSGFNATGTTVRKGSYSNPFTYEIVQEGPIYTYTYTIPMSSPSDQASTYFCMICNNPNSASFAAGTQVQSKPTVYYPYNSQLQDRVFVNTN